MTLKLTWIGIPSRLTIELLLTLNPSLTPTPAGLCPLLLAQALEGPVYLRCKCDPSTFLPRAQSIRSAVLSCRFILGFGCTASLRNLTLLSSYLTVCDLLFILRLASLRKKECSSFIRTVHVDLPHMCK